MSPEKFQSEVETLNKFFSKFCQDKHTNQDIKLYELKYKNSLLKNEINLCPECHNLISYSFERLQECPHDIKPRCRRCPNPCYEKSKWKSLAKLMRYSGIKLGLSKIKTYLKI